MYVTELLQACSELEENVGRIYRAFATRFDGNKPAARLWREMALEEETHADVLARECRAFEERDDSGPFLAEYDRRIDELQKRMRAVEQRAASCSLDDAFAVASELERCGLEELFEDLVVQGDEAFKLLSERLQAALSSLPPRQERIAKVAEAHRKQS